MIKKFPAFTTIDTSHRVEVEAITSKFEPYSDFNFISLFCWNTDGSAEISTLNGNLVIKLLDYITGKPIYSLVGSQKIDESLKVLLAHVDKLQLVPEAVIKLIKNKTWFEIEEDANNHDYIYSVHEHAHLPGKKFRGKKKKSRRFERIHSQRYQIREVNLTDKEAADKVIAIFDRWASSKNKDGQDVKSEKEAITRLLQHSPNLNTVGLMITVDEQPAGFSIHELVGKNYAICHFHKTIPRYGNIDVFLSSAASKDLMARGRTFVNWEQDLGLAGLRKSKSSYHPVQLLKKYTIRLSPKGRSQLA